MEFQVIADRELGECCKASLERMKSRWAPPKGAVHFGVNQKCKCHNELTLLDQPEAPAFSLRVRSQEFSHFERVIRSKVWARKLKERTTWVNTPENAQFKGDKYECVGEPGMWEVILPNDGHIFETEEEFQKEYGAVERKA
jgi:hypothetical protein